MYLWFTDNTSKPLIVSITGVVICFQNVSLIYWQHRLLFQTFRQPCCDLLSKCIFDLLTTPMFQFVVMFFRVVICFQNVSLIYWQHPQALWCVECLCCDLLSKCIFDLLTTPNNPVQITDATLWFAFKMYLWFTDNTMVALQPSIAWVVICFQNVSLIYWQHHSSAMGCRRAGCDLLSKCIFDLLTTPGANLSAMMPALWFAFKMYLWFTDNTNGILWWDNQVVVICFQNVSLIYWQHPIPKADESP